MDEIKFVIKSFLFTALLVFCLQFKVGEKTADKHINDFLQGSRLISWMRDMGTGAVRMTASTYNAAKEQKFPELPQMPKLPTLEQIAPKESAVGKAAEAKELSDKADQEMVKKFEEIENQ
jgi:hypothetical protein